MTNTAIVSSLYERLVLSGLARGQARLEPLAPDTAGDRTGVDPTFEAAIVACLRGIASGPLFRLQPGLYAFMPGEDAVTDTEVHALLAAALTELGADLDAELRLTVGLADTDVIEAEDVQAEPNGTVSLLAAAAVRLPDQDGVIDVSAALDGIGASPNEADLPSTTDPEHAGGSRSADGDSDLPDILSRVDSQWESFRRQLSTTLLQAEVESHLSGQDGHAPAATSGPDLDRLAALLQDGSARMDERLSRLEGLMTSGGAGQQTTTPVDFQLEREGLTRLSAAFQLILRRIGGLADELGWRLDAMPDPQDVAAGPGAVSEPVVQEAIAPLAAQIEAVAQSQSRIAAQVEAMQTAMSRPVPNVDFKLERDGLQRLSIGLQTVLRRLDSQADAYQANAEQIAAKTDEKLEVLLGDLTNGRQEIRDLLTRYRRGLDRLDDAVEQLADHGFDQVERGKAMTDCVTRAVAEILARLEQGAATGSQPHGMAG